ncbi:auxin-responsive protein IAA5-like [Triticum urartu]|uniref:Auxin-responsive protein n=1 Tax=Triticum urartu TaxID=4572 RepID=A0A8R7TXD5_TRIUA|nr:auxin-responsive protein IAA5-like [Triticum urartu]
MSPPLESHDYIGLSAPTPSSSSCSSSPSPAAEAGPRLTLRLGLPGSESPDRDRDRDGPADDVAPALTLGPAPHKAASKRAFPDASPRRGCSAAARAEDKPPSAAPPAAKAQVVGWPPVRNYRKNTLAASASKAKAGDDGAPHYVKVSMDGAPYLRKVDLKMYSSYEDLSMALQKMFSCFITGQSSLRKPSSKDRLTNRSNVDSLQDQEYVLTYEDKDADWMLVGDLPWDLFTTICRKLKIMRGSDAAGIAPRSLEQTGQNK